MEKIRNITIKVLVSEDEKNQIEQRAVGKPLSSYLRDVGLGGDTTFSGESWSDDDKEAYALMVERGYTLSTFMERLVYKLDVLGERTIYKWLKEDGQAKPKAQHPFYGYTVVDVQPGMRRVTVAKNGVMYPISAELDNESYLPWFFNEAWEPYYQLGDVVGHDVPFKQQA